MYGAAFMAFMLGAFMAFMLAVFMPFMGCEDRLGL
jgi:hypothetical protein